MMSRTQTAAKRRSTLLWILGVVVVGGAGLTYYYGDLRSHLVKETAGIMTETLGAEPLKAQSQQLAAAVVQTVLKDPDVIAQAAYFLREASALPETQAALLDLALHILQHEDCTRHLEILGVDLLQRLAADEDVVASMGRLLAHALQDPAVRLAAAEAMSEMGADPRVGRALAETARAVAADEGTQRNLGSLARTTARDVLEDPNVQFQSREFAARVLGDESLQRQGGHAIWNSVTHALRPDITRVVGFCLVFVSVGLARISLSPF